MITTQYMHEQTGLFFRPADPYRDLDSEMLRERMYAATNPPSPIRNPLAGAIGEGLFSRIAAWFRGER